MRVDLAALISITDAAAHEDGLKIDISANMERVLGAVTGERDRPGGFESDLSPAASEIAYFCETATDLARSSPPNRQTAAGGQGPLE